VIKVAGAGDRRAKAPSSLEAATGWRYDDRGGIDGSFHLEKEGKAPLSLALSIL
jgi:hypothetical protein